MSILFSLCIFLIITFGFYFIEKILLIWIYFYIKIFANYVSKNW